MEPSEIHDNANQSRVNDMQKSEDNPSVKAELCNSSSETIFVPSVADEMPAHGDASSANVEDCANSSDSQKANEKIDPTEEKSLLDEATFDTTSFVKKIESIQNSIQSATLERKEQLVTDCFSLLKAVNEIFTPNLEALGLDSWRNRVLEVQESYKQPKTTIGLLGQTGVGKSSLVNALLEEEQIVPTSGMQACTAVPIQIAFNNHTASAYRAEIEFVSSSEWEEELQAFLRDMEATSEEKAETASSRDKVNAVHPNLRTSRVTKEDISQAMASVKTILATTETVESNSSKEFNGAIQKYVFTSKKKSKKGDEDSDETNGELWPLVKSVRIYTKSPALATGAVLVDLPGFGDSNAARTNVARCHMGLCDFLWILSPIKRAVNDEAAKKLLGSSLNAQLIMDGSVNKTSFICTSTDDILVTEFSDLTTADEENSETEDDYEKKRDLEVVIEKLQQEIDNVTSVEDDYDDQIADLENIMLSLQTQGALPRKRIGASSETGSAKRRKISGSDATALDDNRDVDFDANLALITEVDNDSERMQHLKEKLQDLRAKKREQRQSKKAMKDLLAQKKSDKERTGAAAKAASKSHDDLVWKCIKERNEICRSKIRTDFADCIREFEEIETQRKYPQASNKSHSQRDYDSIASQLPVFCASSIAYQKLQGCYLKDRKVICFPDKESTEIPAIRAHCIQLTRASRNTACSGFLVEFCELVTSLEFWAQNCANAKDSLPNGSMECRKSIMSELDGLQKALEEEARKAISRLRSNVRKQITQKFESSIDLAIERVGETVESWNTLRWNTYKATCRRYGVFRKQDWNQALLDPMLANIAQPWSTLFTSLAPKFLEDFRSQVKTELDVFQQKVVKAQVGSPLEVSREFLQTQVSNFKLAVDFLCDAASADLLSSQKSINRGFGLRIQHIMKPAYEFCRAESGAECYERMKAHMSKYIEQLGRLMFQKSCNEAKQRLHQLTLKTEQEMLNRVQRRIELLCNDFNDAMGDSDGDDNQPVDEVHRQVAQQVLLVLSGINKI